MELRYLPMEPSLPWSQTTAGGPEVAAPLAKDSRCNELISHMEAHLDIFSKPRALDNRPMRLLCVIVCLLSQWTELHRTVRFNGRYRTLSCVRLLVAINN